MAKRIILMYISEISGHHSATLAIEKALKAAYPACETLNINAFNYTNPITEKVINRLYMSVIKSMPGIWDYLYDNPAVINKLEKIKDTIHKLNSGKLKKLFLEFKPDAVACTQAFPCGMVADFKKTHNLPVKLIAVLTDYVPHSYWIYETVNYYISPCDDVTERLQQKGIPLYKIKALGIPFDQKFNEPLNRNKIMQKLKLDADLPVILIMGGGQGLGPIKTIVASLEKSAQDMQLIVVAGTNKKLYNSLKRKIKKYKNETLLFGYADNINELMAASNIIVSKPGGVTTAEVLAKGLPMVIVKPIPGQEANNTAFLTSKGAALKIDEPKEIGPIIEGLLSNPLKLNRMREAALSIAKPCASVDIARLLAGLNNV